MKVFTAIGFGKSIKLSLMMYFVECLTKKNHLSKKFITFGIPTSDNAIVPPSPELGAGFCLVLFTVSKET